MTKTPWRIFLALLTSYYSQVAGHFMRCALFCYKLADVTPLEIVWNTKYRTHRASVMKGSKSIRIKPKHCWWVGIGNLPKTTSIVVVPGDFRITFINDAVIKPVDVKKKKREKIAI